MADALRVHCSYSRNIVSAWGRLEIAIVIFMQELSTVPVPTLFADEHTKKADGGVTQTQAWKPRGLFVQNVVLIRAGRLNNIVQGKYDCAHVVPR